MLKKYPQFKKLSMSNLMKKTKEEEKIINEKVKEKQEYLEEHKIYDPFDSMGFDEDGIVYYK